VIPWEEFPRAWVVYIGKEHSLFEINRKDFLEFNGAIQYTLRKFQSIGEISYNLGIFDTNPRIIDLQIPIRAKIITRRKIRGSTDIFIGPEKHFINPERLAELMRNV